MPMISIIVPVYKAESYIRRCIDSILSQTYTDFELILVDDGSPDRSGAICDDYAAKDDRIKVIHQKNSGVSSARNTGLDMAQGTFVSFIDSDDWIHPQFYELLINAAEEYAVDGLTINNTWVAEDTCSVIPYSYDDLSKRLLTKDEIVSNLYSFIYIQKTRHLLSCGLYGMYRRICFSDIRFIEGIASGEDVDVIFRLNMNASSVVHIDAPIYYYFTGNESATRSALSQAHLTLLSALMNVYHALTLRGLADASKIIYRYLYTYFDLDCRARLTGNQQLMNCFNHYKQELLKNRQLIYRNIYCSFSEKFMLWLYIHNFKAYRYAFGKIEQHMLSKLKHL